jgi:hypothetical protein
MSRVFSSVNVKSLVLIIACVGGAWIIGAMGGLDGPAAVRVGLASALAVVAWRVVRTVAFGDADAEAEQQRPGFEQAALMVDVRMDPRPEELERLESVMVGVVSGASDLHIRLRPDMRSVAIDRLRTRRGIDLDTNPEAARRLLGDELFDIVRPDRPPTQDRGSAGVSPTVVEAFVATLEAL